MPHATRRECPYISTRYSPPNALTCHGTGYDLSKTVVASWRMGQIESEHSEAGCSLHHGINGLHGLEDTVTPGHSFTFGARPTSKVSYLKDVTEPTITPRIWAPFRHYTAEPEEGGVVLLIYPKRETPDSFENGRYFRHDTFCKRQYRTHDG